MSRGILSLILLEQAVGSSIESKEEAVADVCVSRHSPSNTDRKKAAERVFHLAREKKKPRTLFFKTMRAEKRRNKIEREKETKTLRRKTVSKSGRLLDAERPEKRALWRPASHLEFRGSMRVVEASLKARPIDGLNESRASCVWLASARSTVRIGWRKRTVDTSR